MRSQSIAIFCPDDLAAVIDGDAGVVPELRDIFAAEAARIHGELHRALATGDHRQVARSAHALRGMAGNVGGRATCELATAIEDAAHAGDTARSRALVAELPAALEALHRALDRFIDDHSSGPRSIR